MDNFTLYMVDALGKDWYALLGLWFGFAIGIIIRLVVTYHNFVKDGEWFSGADDGTNLRTNNQFLGFVHVICVGLVSMALVSIIHSFIMYPMALLVTGSVILFMVLYVLMCLRERKRQLFEDSLKGKVG